MKWTGKNDWLRKLTPRRVAVTEMKQGSVEERFVICCLLLVANKLGIEKWQRNTAARKLFVLNVALVTNSKIVPPKTILRNIWWQTNKHWWNGQAGTKNCHDHVRQEGVPQINLANQSCKNSWAKTESMMCCSYWNRKWSWWFAACKLVMFWPGLRIAR